MIVAYTNSHIKESIHFINWETNFNFLLDFMIRLV